MVDHFVTHEIDKAEFAGEWRRRGAEYAREKAERGS
jgi:hypothetical protein